MNAIGEEGPALHLAVDPQSTRCHESFKNRR
jgi:hypothetical protein